jgi:hypothetical protein
MTSKTSKTSTTSKVSKTSKASKTSQSTVTNHFNSKVTKFESSGSCIIRSIQDKQTNRQTDKQTNRQTDKQKLLKLLKLTK